MLIKSLYKKEGFVNMSGLVLAGEPDRMEASAGTVSSDGEQDPARQAVMARQPESMSDGMIFLFIFFLLCDKFSHL